MGDQKTSGQVAYETYVRVNCDIVRACDAIAAAVLADYVSRNPPLEPLSIHEVGVLDMAERRTKQGTYEFALAVALRKRFPRTAPDNPPALLSPATDPLTAEERQMAEWVAKGAEDRGYINWNGAGVVARALLRVCPKPAPAKRWESCTLEQAVAAWWDKQGARSRRPGEPWVEWDTKYVGLCREDLGVEPIEYEREVDA